MKKKFIIIAILTTLAFSLVGCMPKGVAGLPGATGTRGEQGIQGIQGARGEKGEQGEKGDRGKQGEDGERGKEGDEGDEGDRGRTGATGSTGAKGNAGDKGDTGASAMFLILVTKDSGDWSVVTDEGVGYLLYEVTGDKFVYCFWAIGLEDETEYSLIYYADTEDRFVDWGGDNPGALIDVFTSDGDGEISMVCNSEELDMSLPHPDDANGYYYNYTESDGYTHPFGAKLWLVPSDCYDAGAREVDVWSPNNFLFETDLIIYIDTDL